MKIPNEKAAIPSARGRILVSAHHLFYAEGIRATGVDRVIAVGVNCCRPEDVTPAIKVASAVTGKPVVAYPNSGEGWDAAAGRWCGPATFSAARVGEWIDAGARLIGGCCRVGPDQIAALRHALSTA